MLQKPIVGMFTALMLLGLLAVPAFAETGPEIARVGVSGYDVVAYHLQGKATPGNGYMTARHEGVTYLFSSEENKAAFEKNPEKYLPAYGGYCAYGVSAGKKFYASPEVWKIVDGVLYLNLDSSVQEKWNADIPGHIATADKHWKAIKKTPVEKL